MYIHHEEITAPDNEDTMIWRYMNLFQFISLLRTESIYFTRIDRFDDQYEGKPGIGNITLDVDRVIGLMEDVNKDNMNERIKRIQESKMFMAWRCRMETFANCWHMNEHESAALWKQYGTDGIAVQSTIGRLRNSFDSNNPEEVYIGEISYVDYDKAIIPDGWVWSLALYKRSSFAHERELRAFIHKSGPKVRVDEHHIRYVWDQQPLALTHNVDIHSLIERIYVAPGGPSWFRTEVAAIAAKFGVSPELVIRSPLNDPWLF